MFEEIMANFPKSDGYYKSPDPRTLTHFKQKNIKNGKSYHKQTVQK